MAADHQHKTQTPDTKHRATNQHIRAQIMISLISIVSIVSIIVLTSDSDSCPLSMSLYGLALGRGMYPSTLS